MTDKVEQAREEYGMGLLTKDELDDVETRALLETVGRAPTDDEPVMFGIGAWQIYVVPTGD